MGMGNIADTGLQTSMSNMEVISNNIANAATYGFKSSSASFADIYPASVGSGSNQPGLGVTITNIFQNFESGGYTSTDGPTDLALTSNGFFIVHDPISGQISYTRNGQFISEGDYLVNANGVGRLQGFPATNNVIVPGAAPADIMINTAPINAQASTHINAAININASLPLSTGTFSPSNTATYAYNSSCPTVYDSLGNPHTISLYYIKSAANTYTVQATIDGTAMSPALDGSLVFNGNGQIQTVTSPMTVTFSPTGATSPQSVNINLTGSTQNGNPSSSSLTADGFMAGTYTGISIDNNGNVTAQYSNGQTNLVAQVATATFQNPQGLQNIGTMSWTVGATSGSPVVSQGNSTGAFTTGQLELSNVDLSSELINLITAQHNFQANAQVEQTYNEIMQTVTQL